MRGVLRVRAFEAVIGEPAPAAGASRRWRTGDMQLGFYTTGQGGSSVARERWCRCRSALREGGGTCELAGDEFRGVKTREPEGAHERYNACVYLFQLQPSSLSSATVGNQT